jgi:galactose mutarotase-like enzyme
MNTYTSNGSKLIIDPNGCKINHLNLNGQHLLWSGERPDGKRAATHICFPNFGKVTTGELQTLDQHGPARNQEWEKINDQPPTYAWEHPGTKFYPHGIKLTRRFYLGGSHFTVSTVVKNTTDKNLPINIGEHCYFAIPSKLHAAVTLNGKAVETKKLEGTDYRRFKKNLLVEIPEVGTLSLKGKGYNQVALWALNNAEYLCIEPIAGKPDDIYKPYNQLRPGEKREYFVKLTLI